MMIIAIIMTTIIAMIEPVLTILCQFFVKMDNPGYLFKVKKNQIRMMYDRGYKISDNELALVNYSLEDFINSGLANPDAVSNMYTSDKRPDVFVKYLATPKIKSLGMREIRDIIAYITTLPSRNIILITDVPFSTTAKTELDSLETYNFQIFNSKELTYIPIDNYLVPKHELLNEDEVKKLVANEKISKIPKISIDDPIAKYYGANKGDVFKIHRVDLTGLQYVSRSISYRVVV